MIRINRTRTLSWLIYKKELVIILHKATNGFFGMQDDTNQYMYVELHIIFLTTYSNNNMYLEPKTKIHFDGIGRSILTGSGEYIYIYSLLSRAPPTAVTDQSYSEALWLYRTSSSSGPPFPSLLRQAFCFRTEPGRMLEPVSYYLW